MSFSTPVRLSIEDDTISTPVNSNENDPHSTTNGSMEIQQLVFDTDQSSASASLEMSNESPGKFYTSLPP